MKLRLRAGSTSVRVLIFIPDTTRSDGGGLTGLTNASSGLVAAYAREDDGNAGATSISIVSATLGTFTSGGFKEKDATKMPGDYELGLPDAVLAVGSRWARITLQGAANMAPVELEIELDPIGQTFIVQSDGGNSATQVKTDRTEATDNFWTDVYVRPLTGTLKGQLKKVTAYTGSSKIIAFNAFTGTPANGVVVELIPA
jgi:hypothetical protein